MHDVYHQAVPSNLRGMFRITTDVHNYRTTGLHQTNIIMLSTLEQKKWKNHLRELVLWWNGLPKSLKSLRKSQFKSKIKQILLEIPQKTDDYTDVPPILNVMLGNKSDIISYIFHLFPCLPPISLF